MTNYKKISELLKEVQEIKKSALTSTKTGNTAKELIEKARKVVYNSREDAYVEDTGRYDTATIIFNDVGSVSHAKKRLAVVLSDFQYEIEDYDVYEHDPDKYREDDVSFEVKLISYLG